MQADQVSRIVGPRWSDKWAGFGSIAAPAFYAPLADSGAGAVNTTLALGTGSPTFTRAGATATTILSNGLVSPVIGANVARSYYDPTTLEYRGYLAEGARTNLFLRSAEFDNATWNKNSVTVTANAVTSPDGTLTADKNDYGAFPSANVNQDTGITNNATYTFSCWVKADAPTTLSQQSFSLGAVQYDSGDAVWNVTTTWQRFTRTFTVSGVTTDTILRSSMVTRDSVARTFYMWGAQLELGAFASSYIPTTSAAVTRNADALTYQFATNANATVGTAYAELSTEWAAAVSGLDFCALIFTDGELGPFMNLSAPPTSTTMYDGTTTAGKAGISSFATGARKRAASWGAAGMAITGDGLAPGTAAFDGDIGSVNVFVGGNSAGGSSWYGTIKNARIWTTQLSDVTLRAMTA